MAEPFLAPESVMHAIDHIVYHCQPYNGVYFSSLQLYSDTINDKVDDNCLVAPETIASFWPGGIAETGGQFATVNTEVIGNDQIVSIREKILDLKLSKAALRRWDNFNLHARADDLSYEQERNRFSDEDIVAACAISDVPFAIVSLSKVIRHRFTPPGNYVASVHFPTAMKSPVYALDRLQDAQRQAIAEEQF